MLTYLFMLMTSWAIVCDVYYLKPTTIQVIKSASVSIFYMELRGLLKQNSCCHHMHFWQCAATTKRLQN